MTNQEYLESGILELYAAGGLTETEKAEVDEMARKHPEIRTALAEIQQAMEAYAKVHAVTPPAALKSRIMSSIAGHNQLDGNLITEMPATRVSETNVIDINRASDKEKSNTFSWLSIAASILLLLSAALNFYFYKNWKSAENNLAVALTGQQQMAGNYQTVQQKLSETERAVQILQNENTKAVALAGLPKSPEAQARVHWHAETKTVLLNVKNLPPAPEGKQYQLWALDNGKPVDAGIINLEGDAVVMQKMKEIGSAQAFAVTLEPAGGSVNPTLEEMYLMGKI